MSDYPLFIPGFVLYTKSVLLWFKITNEFRNYLIFSFLYYTKLYGHLTSMYNAIFIFSTQKP